MISAWKPGLDGTCIEVAVALEVANTRLANAANPAERQDAVDFALDLWQAIGRLAAHRRDLDDRDNLIRTAGEVRQLLDPAQLIERNTAHAQALTVRFIPGALRRLLDDWHAHRCMWRNADFGHWIVDRLDSCSATVSAAA